MADRALMGREIIFWKLDPFLRIAARKEKPTLILTMNSEARASPRFLRGEGVSLFLGRFGRCSLERAGQPERLKVLSVRQIRSVKGLTSPPVRSQSSIMHYRLKRESMSALRWLETVRSVRCLNA